MDELDKKIREIKINRQPECWLENIFMNLTEYIHDDYPNLICYKKRNDILFKYDLKSECFYYDYFKIFKILSNKYNCDDNKINNLIYIFVKKYLKLNVKTYYAQNLFFLQDIK